MPKPSFDPDEYDRELARRDRLDDHTPAASVPPRIAPSPLARPLAHVTDDLNEELRRRHVRRAELRQAHQRRRRIVDATVAVLAFALLIYIVWQGAGGPAWPTP